MRKILRRMGGALVQLYIKNYMSAFFLNFIENLTGFHFLAFQRFTIVSTLSSPLETGVFNAFSPSRPFFPQRAAALFYCRLDGPLPIVLKPFPVSDFNF